MLQAVAFTTTRGAPKESPRHSLSPHTVSLLVLSYGHLATGVGAYNRRLENVSKSKGSRVGTSRTWGRILRDLKDIETNLFACPERHRTLWIQVRNTAKYSSSIPCCIFNLCRVGYTRNIVIESLKIVLKQLILTRFFWENQYVIIKVTFFGRWCLWKTFIRFPFIAARFLLYGKLTNDLSLVFQKWFSCIALWLLLRARLLLHFWWMMEAKKPFSSSSPERIIKFCCCGHKRRENSQ